jgi:hypothetical protein
MVEPQEYISCMLGNMRHNMSNTTNNRMAILPGLLIRSSLSSVIASPELCRWPTISSFRLPDVFPEEASGRRVYMAQLRSGWLTLVLGGLIRTA